MPHVIEILIAVFSGCLFVLLGAQLWRLPGVINLIRLAARGGLTVLVGPAWASDHGQLGPISPDIKHWPGPIGEQTEGWLCVCRRVEARSG